MNKKLILLLSLVMVTVCFGQVADRLNPPFPRTAIFNMADPTDTYMDGVRYEMLKKFDMVMIYGMDDFGGTDYATKLRSLNPEQILFASGINSVNDRDPVEYFLYRSYRAVLTEDIVPNQEYITVSSTDGILTGETSTNFCFIVIGGDLIKVHEIVDETTLKLEVDQAGRYIVSENHAAGDTLLSALRRSGPGILPNYSQYGKAIDGKYVWDYITEENFLREVNWTSGLFDGMYHDFFSYNFSAGSCTYDFDLNGVHDPEEHSQSWIVDQWHYGIEQFLQAELDMMNQLTPDLPNLLTVNDGGELVALYEYLNGHQFEGFQRFCNYSYLKNDAISWMSDGQEPNMMSIFDGFQNKHIHDGKDRFYNVRFGLTTAMMFDMYYGYGGGDTFWLFYWYDEFETDLGYPTGPFSELPNGLMVRYFDKGVAVCNATGSDQTLTADMLTGGPFYRLKGGQDPVMNNGEVLTSVSLYGYDYGDRNLRGDGILLFYEPTTAVCDIVVDNFYLNASSPGQTQVEFTGSWSREVSENQSNFIDSNPYWALDGSKQVVITDKYNYDEAYGYHVTGPGDGSRTATWRPNIGVEGWYEVSEWHGWHGIYESSYEEATNVPFELGSGDQVRLRGAINQQTNIGQWNRLGFLYLTPGSDGYVKITNEADGYVIVDAMRFKYIGDESVTPDETPPATPTNVQVY